MNTFDLNPEFLAKLENYEAQAAKLYTELEQPIPAMRATIAKIEALADKARVEYSHSYEGKLPKGHSHAIARLEALRQQAGVMLRALEHYEKGREK